VAFVPCKMGKGIFKKRRWERTAEQAQVDG
jgi:hypothetical protein